jgi:hypothetical protein
VGVYQTGPAGNRGEIRRIFRISGSKKERGKPFSPALL